jgi:hypothetical protein
MALAQGAIYAASGLWPLVHMRSFEAVSGPKLDEWLERTVAGLLVVVGVAEIDAARRDEVTRGMALVGAGSAATLATVSAWYAARGRIRKVYFVDAALEAALLAGWGVAAITDRTWRRS